MTAGTLRPRGLSWDGEGATPKKYVGLLVALALFAIGTVTADPAAASESVAIGVIVREASPASDTAELLVEAAGGAVIDHIDIIGGFTATVPESARAALALQPAIAEITPDGSVTFASDSWADRDSGSNYDGNSVYLAAYSAYAKYFWQSGYDGEGVDVALIDTGVAPVDGLTYPGKVVNGPDLSFESQSPEFRYLDTYGHGTHMAGIIAGRDNSLTSNPGKYYSRDFYEGPGFIGMAPGARIVNVKVGDHEGATDVSQVIAAIDWVVQNRNKNGLNIRVLNLSFGTDSTQPYVLDPLAFAAEQAWKAGIVVVVSGGNDGNGTPLRNPASDPFVIAVGASNIKQTYSQNDDSLSKFSSCGTSARSIDLIAPGQSIRSLRVPGGEADRNYPTAVVDGRFFKGSGTSQAAAMVSGAAALVISQRPTITPDQLKALLVKYADPVDGASTLCQGAGELDLKYVRDASTPSAVQTFEPSKGTGSLEAARGTDHLSQNGVALTGEKDIFGKTFKSSTWAPLSAGQKAWNGGSWNGSSWTGSSWSGTSWSGLSWSGTSWSGTSWSGLSWSGTSWSGMTWTGGSWSGSSWSGTSWSGTSWSGTSWSDNGWLGQSWG